MDKGGFEGMVQDGPETNSSRFVYTLQIINLLWFPLEIFSENIGTLTMISMIDRQDHSRNPSVFDHQTENLFEIFEWIHENYAKRIELKRN